MQALREQLSEDNYIWDSDAISSYPREEETPGAYRFFPLYFERATMRDFQPLRRQAATVDSDTVFWASPSYYSTYGHKRVEFVLHASQNLHRFPKPGYQFKYNANPLFSCFGDYCKLITTNSQTGKQLLTRKKEHWGNSKLPFDPLLITKRDSPSLPFLKKFYEWDLFFKNCVAYRRSKKDETVAPVSIPLPRHFEAVGEAGLSLLEDEW